MITPESQVFKKKKKCNRMNFLKDNEAVDIMEVKNIIFLRFQWTNVEVKAIHTSRNVIILYVHTTQFSR